MSDPARSFVLHADVARWLVTDGLELITESVADLDAGADELSVGSRLRERTPGPPEARAVVDAAVARRRAREHHARGEELVLLTSALEQSSHPDVSAWRAARYDVGPILDLCSGIGGDALAMAQRGGRVTAVDLDAGRLILLEHNARVLGLDVEVVLGDALSVAVSPSDRVHADPGRRIGGRRVRRLADHLPSVPALLDHVARGHGAGIALSPAVDLHDPGLPTDVELEFLQVGPRLVESSLWTRGLREADVRATASLVDLGVSWSRDRAPTELAVGEAGEWLVEPQPAVTRARLHGELGERLDARRLARRRALLTTDRRPDPTPWATIWRIEEVLPLRAKTIKRWLAGTDQRPLEIATHGVDADPSAWWKQLGKPPRGPDGRRLHLVRTDERAVCIATVPDGPDGSRA